MFERIEEDNSFTENRKHLQGVSYFDVKDPFILFEHIYAEKSTAVIYSFSIVHVIWFHNTCFLEH